MESRAWGATKKRTNLYALKLRRGDVALLAVTIGVLAAAIYIRLYVYVPTINQLLQGFF
jgi:energy-coupling factor transporter transmembrane protein EcfT